MLSAHGADLPLIACWHVSRTGCHWLHTVLQGFTARQAHQKGAVGPPCQANNGLAAPGCLTHQLGSNLLLGIRCQRNQSVPPMPVGIVLDAPHLQTTWYDEAQAQLTPSFQVDHAPFLGRTYMQCKACHGFGCIQPVPGLINRVFKL